jgi:hypothetical protein
MDTVVTEVKENQGKGDSSKRKRGKRATRTHNTRTTQSTKPEQTSEVKSKPKTNKPIKPETCWFAIVVTEGELKVTCTGNRLTCIKWMADFTKENPGIRASVYIAHGAKILGY